MAVAFIFESDIIGQVEYDELNKAIARESLDAPRPAGLIAHLAGAKADGGWRVVDVWAAEDDANAFYGSEQFAPVMAGAEAAGIGSTPWSLHRVEVFETISQMT